MTPKNGKLIAILATTLSFSSLFGGCIGTVRPYMREADKINKETCKELKLLYGIDCPGLGFRMTQDPNIVQTLYIRLSVDQFIDANQARRLTLNIIDIYLRQIRANKEFIDKCAVNSFDENNLDIIIGQARDPVDLHTTYLDCLFVGRGYITFVYERKDGEITNSQYIKETIAEARQKVADEDRGIERCQN